MLKKWLFAAAIMIAAALLSSCVGTSSPTSVPENQKTPSPQPSSSLTPSPTPTSPAGLSLGESSVITEKDFGGFLHGNDNILLTVVEYKFSDSILCQGPYNDFYPEDWATYLWVYITAENVGDFPEYIPDIDLSYKGEHIDAKSISCENVDFLDTARKLKPSEHKEGWKVFEVPKSLDVSLVQVGVAWPAGGMLTPYWRLMP